MTDRDLGMHRRITRRDFLNGVALAVGGTAFLPNWGAALLGTDAGTSLAAVQTTGRSVYPPALTGLRGSHAGSFEAFHALKDGTFWDTSGSIVSTRETYDLAVVGSGISGLAAAYYYRKAVGKRARIIVLDNHDDFGGHAKRNEFTANGRMYLGFGGTQSIDSPAPYSPVAKRSSPNWVSMYRAALRCWTPTCILGSACGEHSSSIRKPSGSIDW